MATVEPEVLEALDRPLDPSRVRMVEARGGRKQPYLEQHDVKRQANRIFGYDGWAPRLVELRCIGEEVFEGRDGKEGRRVGYLAIVEVTIDGFLTRSDVGYGDAVEYGGSTITCHELAAKEASSDAMKRAMTSLGDQFGLSLYDKQSAFRNGGQRQDDQSASEVAAHARQLDVDEDMTLRVVRFVLRDKAAGMASIQRDDVKLITNALDYAASNPAEAEKQLQIFEKGDAQ